LGAPAISYINDLVESCEPYTEIYLFANDAKLFRLMLNSNDNCSLQRAINRLSARLASKWLLKLNILKCKVLSLGRNVNKDYRYYILKNSKITYLKQKDSFQNLGIIVDEN